MEINAYLCTHKLIKRMETTLFMYAPVAELVDAPDLGSGGSGRVGSSPIRRTTYPRNEPNAIFSGIYRTKMAVFYHKFLFFFKKT